MILVYLQYNFHCLNNTTDIKSTLIYPNIIFQFKYLEFHSNWQILTWSVHITVSYLEKYSVVLNTTGFILYQSFFVL